MHVWHWFSLVSFGTCSSDGVQFDIGSSTYNHLMLVFDASGVVVHRVCFLASGLVVESESRALAVPLTGCGLSTVVSLCPMDVALALAVIVALCVSCSVRFWTCSASCTIPFFPPRRVSGCSFECFVS